MKESDASTEVILSAHPAADSEKAPNVAGSAASDLGLAALNMVDVENTSSSTSATVVPTSISSNRDGVHIIAPFFRDLIANKAIPGANENRSLADWSGNAAGSTEKARKAERSTKWEEEVQALEHRSAMALHSHRHRQRGGSNPPVPKDLRSPCVLDIKNWKMAKGKNKKVYFAGEMDPEDAPAYVEEGGSFSTSSSRLSRTYEAIPMAPVKKKKKTVHHASCSQAMEEGPMENGEANLDGVKLKETGKRNQGASAMMLKFTEVLPQLEDAIFSTKTQVQLTGKDIVLCSCGEPALFRCPECGVTKMNRYREFLRVGIDEVIITRRIGSLAVRCPACPEIGFNVAKATVDAAAESEKHKFTQFLSSDGNFKLQRKRKVDDPDDFALNGGNAYFPEDNLYKVYVEGIGPADDKCTCSDLKAVRMQNIAKFKNCVISRVVAVQCARHGFFMPGGMVDLRKGEGYAHTDYALAQTLGDAQDQRWIVLTYDVYCQYFKNITSRFKRWFPSMADFIGRLAGAVPKMHIRNHVAQCQSQWSTNFQDYLAFLIGELIEGSWAEMNQFAGSTKEQNHGHRHDSLDDGCGQWNWDKLIHMAETLLKMYREACSAIRKRSPAFDDLTASTDPALISKWAAMDKKWKIVNGKYSSPYDANIKNGPPTHRSAYEKLIKAELTKSLAGNVDCPGNTEFIGRGLRIEKEQHRITAILKTSTTNKAVTARANLRKELIAWRLSDHMRRSLGMSELAAAEYELREGQAYDALADVRIAIKTFNFNVAFKIAQIQGQSSNTRAQNFLRTLANDRIVAADDYRRARAAMLRLGLSPTDKNLAHLVNDELYAKNTRDSPKMGESGDVDPWFWTVGRPANMTPREEKDWSVELDRVKWFRDRANRDRAVEQKELVEVEFGRTVASFKKSAEAWKTLEVGSVPRSGRAAYAHLKDVMYTKLAETCMQVHASAPVRSETDRVEEEKDALAELTRKGQLNQTISDSWKLATRYLTLGTLATRDLTLRTLATQDLTLGTLAAAHSTLGMLAAGHSALGTLAAGHSTISLLDIRRSETLDAAHSTLGTLAAGHSALGTLAAGHSPLSLLDIRRSERSLDAAHSTLGTLAAGHSALGTLAAGHSTLSLLDIRRSETLDAAHSTLGTLAAGHSALGLARC
ncbi:hypothetical protein DFH09DRAFT_1367992 [Mycena vulgaris]|nr:hypothetical protein DFH09DRAFT_1367992 [Mycena vulgaris]